MSTRNITITTRLKDPNNPNGEIYTRAIIKNAIDNNTQIIAGADAQDEFNPSISPYVYKQVNQTEEYVATVLINNSNEGSTPPPPGLSVPLCVFTLNGDACILSRTAARDVLRHILDFGFDGDDLWNLFVALMTATRWLHEKKILHGDIKPENLLVYQTQQGLEFKLFDYDACIVDCSEDTDDIKKGTIAYMEPEVFLCHPVTAASDMWSVGVTLYAAAQAKPLWAKPHAVDPVFFSYREWCDGRGDYPLQTYNGTHEKKKKIDRVIPYLLNLDPKKREENFASCFAFF